MSYGERAALEGLLEVLKPSLSLEIGRAEGGSLRRISAHSGQVVSFDLVEPVDQLAALANVEVMVGDSHRQLPERLAELARDGRDVAFVLIDGDHSTDGVRADMIDLLESDAVTECVVLAHDSLNEDVRRGLDSVPYENYQKVAFVDLDFVPGFVAKPEAVLGQCWGGLGVVVIDASGSFGSEFLRNPTLFPFPEIAWPWAATRRTASSEGFTGAPPEAAGPSEKLPSRTDVELLRQDLDRHRAWLNSIQRSASWKLTAPLRAAKRRLRR